MTPMTLTRQKKQLLSIPKILFQHVYKLGCRKIRIRIGIKKMESRIWIRIGMRPVLIHQHGWHTGVGWFFVRYTGVGWFFGRHTGVGWFFVRDTGVGWFFVRHTGVGWFFVRHTGIGWYFVRHTAVGWFFTFWRCGPHPFRQPWCNGGSVARGPLQCEK